MSTKLKAYSTTAASNNSAAPNGWPEGMQPSDVNNSAREMMARLAEWYADAEWLLRNEAITAYTASTIVVTGDVTGVAAANRAIRLDESNSKVAIITGASYSAPSTTITVTGYTIVALPTAWDLGIANTSAVCAANPKQSADVASAATLNLDAMTGNGGNLTGTTGVTAVTLTNGRSRRLRATGAVPITASASLVLNTVASGGTYTCAVGDILNVEAISGVVYVNVLNSAGATLTSGNINTSGDTTINIPAGAWKKIEVDVVGLTAGTDYAPYLRVNADTGTNYAYVHEVLDSGGGASVNAATGASGILIGSQGSLFQDTPTVNNPLDFCVEIVSPAGTSNRKNINIRSSLVTTSTGGYIKLTEIGARWLSTAAITSLLLTLRTVTGASPGGSVVNASGGTYVVRGYQ